ncbi:uncharacterized protein LOC132564854 [Ylistrum balloti]|uniref:uncharacterized protein LOC132564854 n=1 Tax=Ylistrum balloti TaxID=509963 RepID=UPI002905B51C|nr:uncharacterized protein LOC132564854 [Ylistrum balloti]
MADAHIDLDVLKSSVRFHVTGPRRNSVTRFEIVKALLDGGLVPKNLKSVFRCEAPNSWFATVASESDVNNIVEAGVIEREHFALHPDPCDRRRLTIRVQWLPSWMSDDAIADLFDGFYGKVVSVEREKMAIGKVSLETGTRVMTLIIREGEQDVIPHRMRMFGRTALIGRPPICLRCQQIGHVRSQCPERPEPTTRATYAKVIQCTAPLPPPTSHSEGETSIGPKDSKRSGATVSLSPGGRGPFPTATPGESDPAASSSTGGSSPQGSATTKRSGPDTDDGFQISKKGRHSSFSPAILSNGDLVPGQQVCEGDSVSDMSEDNLIIDEDLE